VRVLVLAFALSGCSSLLGITDPIATHGDDDTHMDAPIDGTSRPGDHVEISLADFGLAQQQAVHLHAKLVHMDGSAEDITASASWASDNTAVATAAPGEVDGIGSGTATITASFSAATPASVHATVSAVICHPIINEVQAGGAASASDEWVEIMNPCVSSIDVDAWSLGYRAASNVGATDTNLMVTLAGSLAPGQIQLFSGPAFTGTVDGGWANGLMQANNGGVGIRDDLGTLIDSVAYGAVAVGHPFVEATAAPALANDNSIARLPFDGNDTDNGGADFTLVTTPTPRATNVK
jgi:hypothetical protein